jgi:hypothetical protein
MGWQEKLRPQYWPLPSVPRVGGSSGPDPALGAAAEQGLFIDSGAKPPPPPADPGPVNPCHVREPEGPGQASVHTLTHIPPSLSVSVSLSPHTHTP